MDTGAFHPPLASGKCHAQRANEQCIAGYHVIEGIHILEYGENNTRIYLNRGDDKDEVRVKTCEDLTRQDL
jgi:hypothetical protein